MCGWQYDWREANWVLTIHTSCQHEDTSVFKAHAPLTGACVSMIVALSLLANWQEKENFIEFYEGIKETSRKKVVAALRQFILSPSCCWISIDFTDAVKEWPEELTLKKGERRGTEGLRGGIERNKWSPPECDSDWSALCQTLYEGVDQEDWESICNIVREAAKKVGLRKSRSGGACCGS